MRRPRLWLLPLILAAGQLAPFRAASTEARPGCAWNGPSIDWVLSRHLSGQALAGALGREIVPRMQRQGVPISLVEAPGQDRAIRIPLNKEMTVRSALEEIERQAPGYRQRTIDGRLVIYPRDEHYDAPVDLGAPKVFPRASAYFYVLTALKREVPLLRQLDLTLRSGGWGSGNNPYGDEIEVGGRRPVIEHLLSLVQGRPSVVFQILASDSGLYFSFRLVGLVSRIEVHGPAKIKVGDAFELTVLGELADQSLVSLAGPGCHVAYAAARPEILSIDAVGRATAHQPGEGTLYAEYEHQAANLTLKVE